MESTQPILRCRYRYDPLDRLISQLQPDAPAHQRFYCKSRLATEIQGAIGFSVFQNNDLLLAQQKSQGGAVESTLLATDLQRSVLQTLTADQQQHPIAYSPYGHRQAESGLTSLMGFNGERPDTVTGHYLLGNGYRAFNPALMRFNCPDNWSPFGEGGINSYTYCLGDPINRHDANGHAAKGHAVIQWVTNLITRARRASATVAKKTGMITLTPDNPIAPNRVLLRPGTTPEQAVKARADLNQINEMLKRENYLDQIYLNDLHTERTRLPSENLYTTPDAISNLFDQSNLLEYIKNGQYSPLENASHSFSAQSLEDVASNTINPKIPSILRPKSQTALMYTKRLLSAKHPNRVELRAKAKQIRTTYFIL
ncbi:MULTISPECIES: RHS repeat-associated core domain-containing protein [Pseudomonas]|uniref:RHS repeat-associated core domain-containing protein n=1 Tax=Pseudomonas TaxID=286 RepID=UPI0009B9FA22|nr:MULTISPECIES: RHS repeat-associated core domain-containing protein [Pseudomonas]